MSAVQHRLDNLICLVDFNDQQADGKSTAASCSISRIASPLETPGAALPVMLTEG